MQGFGAVVVPGSDRVYQQRWEARVFALHMLVGIQDLGGGPGGRPTREAMPAADYLAASYYQRWLWSAERRQRAGGAAGRPGAGGPCGGGRAGPRPAAGAGDRRALRGRRSGPGPAHATGQAHPLPPLHTQHHRADRACTQPGRAAGTGRLRRAGHPGAGLRRGLRLPRPVGRGRAPALDRAGRPVGALPRGGAERVSEPGAVDPGPARARPGADHHGHPDRGGHDHGPHHPRPASEVELRARALEALLVAKGLVTTDAVDAVISYYEHDVGPQNGAKVVARAWLDPAYRQRLLSDGTAAIAELGYGGAEGDNMVVVANTPSVHNAVVCTLCSCYPWP